MLSRSRSARATNSIQCSSFVCLLAVLRTAQRFSSRLCFPLLLLPPPPPPPLLLLLLLFTLLAVCSFVRSLVSLVSLVHSLALSKRTSEHHRQPRSLARLLGGSLLDDDDGGDDEHQCCCRDAGFRVKTRADGKQRRPLRNGTSRAKAETATIVQISARLLRVWPRRYLQLPIFSSKRQRSTKFSPSWAR